MAIQSWIKKLFGSFGQAGRSRSGTTVRRRPRLVPGVEVLEDRLMPASFVVTDNSDDPSDTGSIRYAINSINASNGSFNSITFASSLAGQTIQLTNGQLSIDREVNITGPAGASQLAIAGNNSSPDSYARVFAIAAGANVTIDDLTIENGRAPTGDNGGAIDNAGNLTLIQSTVTGSSTQGSNGTHYPTSFAGDEGAGGGIYNSAGGSLYLEQSTVSNNTAQGGNGQSANPGGGGGGGAGLGGGIYNKGKLDIVNSTISGNTASGGNGGYGSPYVDGGSSGTGGNGGGNGGQGEQQGAGGINGVQTDMVGGLGGGGGGGYGSPVPGFYGNGGNGGFGGGGGGGGAPTFAVSSLSSQGGSGGSYGGAGGAGSATYSFDSGGSYSSGGGGGGAGVGGGIFSSGSLTITASTIADNSTHGGKGENGGANGQSVAGGIFLFGSTATLDSSIVADNDGERVAGGPYDGRYSGVLGYSPTWGENPSGVTSPDLRASLVLGIPNSSFSGSHNLIGNPTGANGLSSSGNLLGVNPQLGGLGNNGGYTQTEDLSTSSPALGQGDPNAVDPFYGDPITVDQRGVARASPPDIGAYELQTSITDTANPQVAFASSGPVDLLDTADLEGPNNPGGQITFTLYDMTSGTPVLVHQESQPVEGNGHYVTTQGYYLSNPLPGEYFQWDVTYSGDSRNSPAADINDPKAVFAVQTTSTITNVASPAVAGIASATVLKDIATLSAGLNPTGTITFKLYDPYGDTIDTETAAVTGNGSYTTPTGYTLPSGALTGGYQWAVAYSGDIVDTSASDDYDPAGVVQVYPAVPTLTGAASASSVTLGSTPVKLTDTATLVNGLDATGTINFQLYYNGGGTALIQETVSVHGDGSYTTPAAYVLPSSGAVAGNYQWDISYSGDSNNGPVSDDNAGAEHVTVSKASPTLSADPIPAQATLGPTSVTLTDAAALSGGFHETGTITFSLKYDNDSTPIYTDTVNVNGDGLYMPAGYTLATTGKVVGFYQWDVTYSGDSNNNGADASANTNQANVDRAKPTLTGTPLPAAVTLGPSPTTLTDQALLLGGYQETGTISFSLYQGAGTTPVFSTSATVSGDGTYTTPTGYVPTAAGAYHWNIFYNGDANNEGIRVDNSAAEDLTVSPAPLANPMLSATAIPAAVTLGTSPVTLKDAAFLSGGAQETGTITFTLYYNGGATPVDTETATVSGDGLYTTPTGYVPTAPGTYQWDVSYSGDGNNSQAADNGDVNNQVIVTASPQISLDQTMLNLGTTTYGTAGATETYDVSGTYLNGPVSIAAPTGVELSTDGANWAGSLTLNPVGGMLASTVVDVRISALADAGTISGDITASSAGAIEQDISVSGTVAPQALTVSIIGDPSKTYDGTTNAMLSSSNYQINGLVNGDNFTVTNTVGAYNSKDVATASTVTALLAAGDFVPVSGTFATNYTFPSSAAGPGQITAATLLYVANPVSRTYGSANPAFTGSVTGLEPGDTLSGVTTGTLTFTSSATAASSVGSYAITGAGLTVDTSDYVLAQAAGNATALTITPAAVTVTIIGDPSKTYDGTTTATLTPANYHISGLLNGDSFTVSNTTGAFNSKDVATASSVTAALVPADFVPVGNALASNYAFPTSASGPGKITPAALTVSIIGDPAKPYDGTTAATLTAANFQVNGVGSGDGFTITKTVGTYNSKNVASATTVTVSLAKTDFSAATGTLVGDYTFPTSASGPGQITPLTLTVAIVGDPTKTYDGTTTAKLTATNYHLSGLLKGEGFTVKQTVGTYNSKDVATANSVTASLAASNFTPSTGTLASNYAFPASASGPGQIRRATLTYHIGNDVMDEGIPVNLASTLPATINTGVNGENLAISYSSLGDTDTALPGRYAITGSIADGTGLASDYTVTLYPGTLTVAPPLQITTTALPAGLVNFPYKAAIQTTGGNGPITFTLAGSLPTGLTLNSNGTITGTPTVTGPVTFNVTATDFFGEETTQTITLCITTLLHDRIR